jgi:hypothetical protein
VNEDTIYYTQLSCMEHMLTFLTLSFQAASATATILCKITKAWLQTAMQAATCLALATPARRVVVRTG